MEEEIKRSGAGQEEPKFDTSGVRSAFAPDAQAPINDRTVTRSTHNRGDSDQFDKEGAIEPESNDSSESRSR
jgi:hypothetical protein